MDIHTLAAKHGFSTAKHMLGALELSILDEQSGTSHAPAGALPDVLDVLAPNRSQALSKTAALWAINAAYQVLQ